jgi:hypothetical protein
MTPFMRGLMRQPPIVVAWVGLLVLANGVASAFFWHTLEANVILVTFGLGGVLMEVLTWRQGFTRLLGLGHVLWLGLVPWLVTRVSLHEERAVVLWLTAVIVLNSMSLVLDVRDVVLYVQGDREPS